MYSKQAWRRKQMPPCRYTQTIQIFKAFVYYMYIKRIYIHVYPGIRIRQYIIRIYLLPATSTLCVQSPRNTACHIYKGNKKYTFRHTAMRKGIIWDFLFVACYVYRVQYCSIIHSMFTVTSIMLDTVMMRVVTPHAHVLPLSKRSLFL